MEIDINKRISDILIPGYVERNRDNFIFHPMYWWVFMILDDGNIIEMYSNDGDIKVKTIEKIKCNFDIEDDDIFCLNSFSEGDCGVIEDIRCHLDFNGNICKIEIKTDIRNIIFDAISSFDGFEIKW